MSMSTHISGYLEADNEWKNMKDLWDLCNKSNILPPLEVREFFDDEYPDDKPGKVVELPPECISTIAEEMVVGYQIELDKIPPHVKFIRFTNHY
jgi:hypothetical protein